MTDFKLKLADVVIGVRAVYESTKEFCSSYLSDEPSELDISVKYQDILEEREADAHSGAGTGFSDEYLERLALYRKIAASLAPFNVILFHGSAVEIDGEGYIFTALSGTGKSTHARLLREEFGDRVKMINDDKPLIRLYETGPVVYGTPWCGKHGLERNVGVPVKSVCLLNRGETNSIYRISGPEAFPVILQQTHRPSEPDNAEKSVVLAAELADMVNCWRMYCNTDPSAARMSCRAMTGGGGNEN